MEAPLHVWRGEATGTRIRRYPLLREEAKRGDAPDKEAPPRVKIRRGVGRPERLPIGDPYASFFCVLFKVVFSFSCSMEWEPSPSNRNLQIKLPLQGGDWRCQWAPSSVLVESAK